MRNFCNVSLTEPGGCGPSPPYPSPPFLGVEVVRGRRAGARPRPAVSGRSERNSNDIAGDGEDGENEFDDSLQKMVQ